MGAQLSISATTLKREMGASSNTTTTRTSRRGKAQAHQTISSFSLENYTHFVAKK